MREYHTVSWISSKTVLHTQSENLDRHRRKVGKKKETLVSIVYVGISKIYNLSPGDKLSIDDLIRPLAPVAYLLRSLGQAALLF